MIHLLPSQQALKTELIAHILNMRTLDIDYARYALKRYAEQLPHLDLMAGVREAMV